MINAQDYMVLENLKIKNPDAHEILQNTIMDHYKVLGIGAHDIKNLISFISSSYQFISHQHPETQTFDFWSDMGNTIQSLTQFMERTTLCRYCINPTFSPITLQNLLYQLPDEADNLYPDTERDFVFDVDPRTIKVMGDAQHLMMALNELVSNAFDATDNNDIIYICTHTDLEEKQISISISNRGMLPPIECIDPAHSKTVPVSYPNTTAEVLCRAFYTTKENHPGVGLYIAQKVCLTHHATLKFRQNEDMTSAILTLPVYDIQ